MGHKAEVGRLGYRVTKILDEDQKVRMLRLREMGISLENLARRFGIKHSLVQKTLTEMRRRERREANSSSR